MKNTFLVIFILAAFYGMQSQTFYQPANTDFEGGEPGQPPIGWDITKSSRESGYSISIGIKDPVSGKQFAKLKKKPDYDTSNDSLEFSGAIFQNLDALPYRNYKVKFRAAVKTDLPGPSAKAVLFIQSRKEVGSFGNFVSNQDDPIQGEEWDYYEIEAEIKADAQQIKYGLILIGEGDVHIDDVSFEIVQPEESELKPPAKLTQKELSDLEALANMYGYTRFFCPSDMVKIANWDRLMLKSVSNILYGDNDLKTDLTRIFNSSIPVFEITGKNEKSTLKYEKPEGALDRMALGWMHSGGFSPRSSRFFYSTVHNLYEPLRKREAAAFQVLDITDHQGESITVKIKIKTKSIGYQSGAQLWIRVDDDRNNSIAKAKSSEFPDNSDEWKEVSATVEIPNNGDLVRLGCVFTGEGKVYFDDLKVFDEAGEEIKLKNPGFERGEPGQRLSSGWVVPGTVRDAGYSTTISNKENFEGNQSLEISSSSTNRIVFPKKQEIFNLRLNDELVLNMPAVLYADSSGSLPEIKQNVDYSIEDKPEGFYPTAEDRTSRIAVTVMAWSVLNNFMIRDVPYEKMKSHLFRSLKDASLAENRDEFMDVLNEMLSITNDSQARVWQGYETEQYALPVLLDVVKDTVFISKVNKSVNNIEPGDRLVAVEGKPVFAFLGEIASGIPVSSDAFGLKRAIAMTRIGEKDSPLKVTIKKNDGGTFDTTLTRSMNSRELKKDRPPKIYEIEKGIAYVDITTLTDKELKDYINSLKDTDGIIFDARGLVETSVHLLGLFIDKPVFSVRWEIPVYTYPDKSIVSQKVVHGIIKGHNMLPDKKLVLLCNETTMGYSEAFLQLVKDYKIGEVIGTPTAGMPGEIIAYRLPGDYNMSLTGMKAYSARQKLMTGKPVEPDIEVYPTIEDMKQDRDPLLEKAKKIIKSE